MNLTSNVTRLKPRLGSYEQALEAFSTGDFRSCVDNLGESTGAEASILRARSFIRLGDASAALDSLQSRDFSGDSHEVAAEALAVECYALYVLQRPSDAALLAVDARARCFSSGLVGIEAELIFASALGSLLSGDFARAEAAAIAVLDLVDESPAWLSSKTYAYSLGFWRARACDIRGVCESVNSNYADHARWARRAFDEFDTSGVRDDYMYASLLANYSDLAVSLGVDGVADFIVSRAESIEWNSHLAGFEFRIFSSLAEASSVQGDQLGALRYFRRCVDCAPSPALRIRAGVERSRLLHAIGESFSAREELDHALRLSRTVNWEIASSLDQRQLVFLAGQVAAFDAAQAVNLMARYDRLVSNNSASVTIDDKRFQGDEFAARAAVLAASGEKERAVLLLIEALATYSDAKLNAKAAFVAAELAALTGEPAYYNLAKKQAAKQPKSILGRKLADEAQPQVLPTVLPFVRPKLSLLS